jgi:hypothetical protein
MLMPLIARSFLASVICLAAWSALHTAYARAPAFFLGEVTLMAGAPSHYRQLLVDTLSAELAAPYRARPGVEQDFVINARLMGLTTKRSHPATSQCTVALMLIKRGAIFATVQGRVVVEESGPERAESLAVQAAAKSALKRARSALGG